jgi:hypothetical protein
MTHVEVNLHAGILICSVAPTWVFQSYVTRLQHHNTLEMTSQSFYPPQCAYGAHQKLLHQCTSQTFQGTTGQDSSQRKKSCFTSANHKHQGHPDFTQSHPQVTNWLDSLLKDVTSVVWMRALHITILMFDCTNRSFELQQLGVLYTHPYLKHPPCKCRLQQVSNVQACTNTTSIF